MCSRIEMEDSYFPQRYRSGQDDPRISGLVKGRASGTNCNSEAPRSFSQILLPQLSKPSQCVLSALLLALVHGLHFLEPGNSTHFDAARLTQHRCHEDHDEDEDVCIERHHHGYDSRHQRSNQPTVLSSMLALASYILQSPSIIYPLLIVATLVSLIALQYHRLQTIIRTTSSIPDLNHVVQVPGASPYMGHLTQLIDPQQHKSLFTEHATPSGISALWGPGLKRSASVLLAEHARLVLRLNSQRDFSEWIIRHGRKTLGEDSLILLAGGQRWKNVRQTVAKAFTNRIVKGGRKVVGESATECVDWLQRACSEEGQSYSGHEVNGEGKRTVCLEAEDVFKMFSLNAFGRVAMGYDFKCFPTCHNDRHERDNRKEQQSHDASSSSSSGSPVSCCTSISMPPEALAFEFLQADVGKRVNPKSFLNPAMQFYSIPTRYNRAYHKNMNLVNGLMETIICKELDAMLGREGRDFGSCDRESTSCDRESQSQSPDMSLRDSLRDDDSIKLEYIYVAEPSQKKNMVTHLLQSCMEQHFSQTPESRRTLSHTSAASSPMGGCPFSAYMSSSPSNSLGNSKSSLNSSFHSSHSSCLIPPPSLIAEADKQKIIQDVSQILHTLLSAGYETTTISLSFVMYCLSRNPRCQERACEEARRVLGRKRNKSDDDDSSIDDDDEGDDVIDDDDLPYCRAVFNESLRLHLPIMFTTRVLSKELTLDTGYDENDTTKPQRATLLKGTRVMIHPLMIHLDKRNFERPSEYIPERWVRWDEGNGRWVERDYEKERRRDINNIKCSQREPTPSPPPFSDEYTNEHAAVNTISAANPANYFSFSDGARNCVGRRLALMESTILIAVLFRDMCVSLGGGDDFELVKERRFVTIKPVSLPIKFWKR